MAGGDTQRGSLISATAAARERLPRAPGRSRIIATGVAFAALASGLAWTPLEPGAAHGSQRLRAASYPVTLARLRAIANGEGAWAALRPGASRDAGAAATVVVGGDGPDGSGARVPKDFLGLSFEATTLGSLPSLAQGRTLTRLLSSIGDGTLRFGGGSVNRYVAWTQPGTPAPRWATHPVSPPDLQALASIARASHWKVLLTLNLAHYNTRSAAQEAAAAHHELGSALEGIAIANEPDNFARFGLRAKGWGFSAYRRQLAGYRAAIAAAAPGARIAAPDASTGELPLPWVWESIALRPALVTDHYYPLTSCGQRPTVSELLSPSVRLKESVMLSALGDIERTARAPLQLDEANNISCKGEPGVSNTFASALWAADFIARAMKSGLAGVDFHDLLNLPDSYSPLVGEGRSLHANPEWYALLLTHSLQGARVLPTAVRTGSELTAQGFVRADGTVQLLLVDFDHAGSRTVRVSLKLPGRGTTRATILRLRAPSADTTSDVTLGGAEVDATGVWHPSATLPSVRGRAGTFAVSMPPGSAALVTVGPPRRATGARGG